MTVGSRNIPAEISDKFIESAGGREANFVYVPTAFEDEKLNSPNEINSLFGLRNVTVLHSQTKKEINQL